MNPLHAFNGSDHGQSGSGINFHLDEIQKLQLMLGTSRGADHVLLFEYVNRKEFLSKKGNWYFGDRINF